MVLHNGHVLEYRKREAQISDVMALIDPSLPDAYIRWSPYFSELNRMRIWKMEWKNNFS